MKNFTKIVYQFCKANADNEELKPFVEPLSAANKEWGDLTTKIGMRAIANQEEIGAAAVDYLMYSGYICLAYFWAVMAKTAQEKLAAGTTEEGFYTAKVQTANFYYKRILPRTLSLAATIDGGIDSLMEMEEDNFSFY